MLELLGVPSRRVVTVYNGVGEEFKPVTDARATEFREEKELGERVVLSIGTLEPRKNLETAIRAFSKLAREAEMADVQLVIGGSKGWCYDTIFKEAERTGLVREGRLRFLGRVPEQELPMWYNVASVVVYPSRYEGFGAPRARSDVMRSPVITSTTAALREVVGDAGVSVDPDDVAGWADAMRSLLTEGDLARSLSEQGLKRAATFSWDRCAQETLGVYRSVVGRRTTNDE